MGRRKDLTECEKNQIIKEIAKGKSADEDQDVRSSCEYNCVAIKESPGPSQLETFPISSDVHWQPLVLLVQLYSKCLQNNPKNSNLYFGETEKHTRRPPLNSKHKEFLFEWARKYEEQCQAYFVHWRVPSHGRCMVVASDECCRTTQLTGVCDASKGE